MSAAFNRVFVSTDRTLTTLKAESDALVAAIPFFTPPATATSSLSSSLPLPMNDNGLAGSRFLWIRAHDYFHCTREHGFPLLPTVALAPDESPGQADARVQSYNHRLCVTNLSSDAVPVHLLTREAFAIYQRHLRPDGAIIVNISNRYLDLRPVVENAAREFGYLCHQIECDDGRDEENEEGAWWLYGSTFMILSKNQEFMANPRLTTAASPPAEPNSIPLWTDDYTSMFRVLK